MWPMYRTGKVVTAPRVEFRVEFMLSINNT